jgi:hypothetical protein
VRVAMADLGHAVREHLLDRLTSGDYASSAGRPRRRAVA